MPYSRMVLEAQAPVSHLKHRVLILKRAILVAILLKNDNNLKQSIASTPCRSLIEYSVTISTVFGERDNP